jgi:hypothetical protein
MNNMVKGTMAMVLTAAIAENFARSVDELRLRYALTTCATVAATARGGQTLTPLSKVWRHEVRREAFVMLLRSTGTVISDRDAKAPLKVVSLTYLFQVSSP